MWLTDNDAKTKWCPMVRAAPMSNATSPGAQPLLNRGYKCISSDCMFWRWKEDELDPDARPGRWPRGYCGAGGKPLPANGVGN